MFKAEGLAGFETGDSNDGTRCWDAEVVKLIDRIATNFKNELGTKRAKGSCTPNKKDDLASFTCVGSSVSDSKT